MAQECPVKLPFDHIYIYIKCAKYENYYLIKFRLHEFDFIGFQEGSLSTGPVSSGDLHKIVRLLRGLLVSNQWVSVLLDSILGNHALLFLLLLSLPLSFINHLELTYNFSKFSLTGTRSLLYVSLLIAWYNLWLQQELNGWDFVFHASGLTWSCIVYSRPIRWRNSYLSYVSAKQSCQYVQC